MPVPVFGEIPSHLLMSQEQRRLTEAERARIFGASRAGAAAAASGDVEHGAEPQRDVAAAARTARGDSSRWVLLTLLTPVALLVGCVPAFLYAFWQEGFGREIAPPEFFAINVLAGWLLIGVVWVLGKLIGVALRATIDRTAPLDPNGEFEFYMFEVSAAALVPGFEDEGAALLLQIAPGVVLVDQSQDYDELADADHASGGARAAASDTETEAVLPDPTDTPAPPRLPARRVRLIAPAEQAALVSIEPVGEPLIPFVVEVADGAGFLKPGLYVGDVHDRETVAAVVRAARA